MHIFATREVRGWLDPPVLGISGDEYLIAPPPPTFYHFSFLDYSHYTSYTVISLILNGSNLSFVHRNEPTKDV
jgi:hypothetical protein